MAARTASSAASSTAARRALEWRLPFVRLLDAAGGSVRHFEEIGRTYLPDGNVWTTIDVDLLSLVPCVSLVLGSVAGGPAVNACLAHFNVMVQGTSHLFPGGPPVVKAALGYDVTKEELGGSHIHVGVSGVVDNLATTEQDALEQVRRFLSYLPSNVYEQPPRATTDDPTDRRAEELLSLIPRNRRRPFDAHRLIDLVVDEGSFFEIAPRYGRGAHHRAGPRRRLPGRRHGQQPGGGRRFDRRRRRREGDPPDPAVRHVPPAARVVRRRARLHGRPRLGDAGDRARRGAPHVGGLQEPDAVDHVRGRPPVRRRRPVPPPPDRHVPALRLAVGALGLDAHPGRRGRCVPPRHRDVARSRGQAPSRSRRGSRRWRRRSARPRPPARTSSTRATPAPCLAEFVSDAQPILATQLGPSPVPYRP